MLCAQNCIRASCGETDEVSRWKIHGDFGIDNDSIPNDRAALLESMKICGKQKDLKRCRNIHSFIVQEGLLHEDLYINNTLICMYTKCGVVVKAHELFEEQLTRNIISWNVMITGYIQNGFIEEALNLFEKMQDEGVAPNEVTSSCILKACGTLGLLDLGKKIHVDLKYQGLLDENVVLGTALMDMYAKCGELANAEEVFRELRTRNVVSWSALISAYAQYDLAEEALRCFRQMQAEGLIPNAVTFICVLKACGKIGALAEGEWVYLMARKQKLLENNIALWNAVIDMYVKCGVIGKARNVFDELLKRDVISLNVMISGYVQQGLADETFCCYQRMLDEGMLPTCTTFIFMLKACGILGLTRRGEEMHITMKMHWSEGNSAILGTALIDMYVKTGSVEKAQNVFNEYAMESVAPWNALIAGYVQNGLDDEAINCFRQLMDENVTPDRITISCVLKACSNIGSQMMGERIYDDVTKRGLFETNVVLGSSLVDMYAKCGAITEAQLVFDKLAIRDIVSWTSLIAGCAQLGQVRAALVLFKRMVAEDVLPDIVVFLLLLTACSHAGVLEEGQTLFDILRTVYSLSPSEEHFTCMIDLFSRAGHFNKAAVVIDAVIPCHQKMWLVLLGACYKWVNVEIGRWVFERILELDGTCTAAYICMGDIYAAAGMREIVKVTTFEQNLEFRKHVSHVTNNELCN